MGLGVEVIDAVDDHRAHWSGVVVSENVGRGINAELRHLLSAGSVQTSVQSIIDVTVFR